MPRRISLAYLTVNGVSLTEHVEVAAETGYQSVGLRLLGSRAPKPDDWPNEALIRETEQRLTATGVTVLDCEIVWLLPDTHIPGYTGLMEVMQRLGAHLLLVLSRDPEQQRAFDNFAALCEMAAGYDVKPCLEFSKVTAVATLQQAIDFAQRTGAPNARVLVDALHLSRSGGTPADVARVDPALFEYAQLCDAPLAMPNEEQMRLEPGDRLLPGQGGLPLVELVRALPPDLPIAVEAPVKQMEFLPASERAWMAMEGLKSILERT
ncbi:MAG TPA: sugar phosphate isomerase/epimerase [Chloroflexota bacterium]